MWEIQGVCVKRELTLLQANSFYKYQSVKYENFAIYHLN